jgi:hypothetical protein
VGKVQSLDGNDLKPAKPQIQSATPQRGEEPKAPAKPEAKTPSDELVSLQFKMPPAFVKSFKQAALDNDMKLNELLKACFESFLKK